MSEPTAVLQKAQWGAEVTAGTAVAANRFLDAVMVAPSLEYNTSFFRPTGSKYPTISQPGREWTTAALTGAPDYRQLVYLFSSLIAPATITTPGGATLARNWQFLPDSDAEHVPQTYTVEVGQAVRAGRFKHGIVNQLGLVFPAQDTPTLSGAMVGHAWEDNVTMTASPTAVSHVPPILGGEFCLHLDPTSGALGTTELTRALNVSIDWPAQRSVQWFHACTGSDWTTAVEGEGAEPTITVQMVADAQAFARLTAARAGTVEFMRLEATSATEIDVGINNYKFTLDAAVAVESVNVLGTVGELVAGDVNFRCLHDETWGKAYDLNVVNNLTAL